MSYIINKTYCKILAKQIIIGLRIFKQQREKIEKYILTNINIYCYKSY